MVVQLETQRASNPQILLDVGAQLASSLQQASATVLSKFLATWQAQTRAEYLCLAGGVFLNALLVGDLELQRAVAPADTAQ